MVTEHSETISTLSYLAELHNVGLTQKRYTHISYRQNIQLFLVQRYDELLTGEYLLVMS